MIMRGQENYSMLRRIIFVIIIAVVLVFIVLIINGQALNIAQSIAANFQMIAPATS